MRERLSEGDNALVKKNDALQRNLEQLTLMYHQLASQKSVLRVDKTVNEKKISRLTEKNKKLETEVKAVREQLEEMSTRHAEEQEVRRLSVPFVLNSSTALTFAKNIKKTIKGGRQSFARQTYEARRREMGRSVTSNPSLID